MTKLTRRLKRLFAWLLGLGGGVTLIGLIAVGGALLYLRSLNAQSDLSQSEWQRLRARFLERATSESSLSKAQTTAEAPTFPTEAPPARATRLPEATAALDPETLEIQKRQYDETRPKDALALQPFRRTTTVSPEATGGPVQKATLVNLNPDVNAWYLLTIDWRGRDAAPSTFHIVNADPEHQDITLDPENPLGLTFVDTAGKRFCELWGSAGTDELTSAAATTTPYRALCDEQVTLRLPVPGRRTTLEWATDFLRDNVWNGEQITVFVRQQFFQDAYLETAEVADAGASAPDSRRPGMPAPARLDPRFADARIGVGELGLELQGVTADGVMAGHWHPAREQPGVYVSVVRPDLLNADVFQGHHDVVSRLDEVEREALVYLVAFDLSRFDVGFAVGTEHPRVDWSERVTEKMRNDALPGPDGIGEINPLVRTGIVPRALAERAVATFTGGFKRSHGAFRVSALAERNAGTHYGFIESGAVLSKLQPGLATLAVTTDGTVTMRTWAETDDALRPRLAFARQNGLPIIEPSPETGEPVPGRHVSQWAAGNWSGSQDRKFRTVRAGAAIQETDGARFLVYAYFSSATPSAMARVFQAYGCRYAMLLDMNALEHTYLALYRVRDGNLEVEHLVQGMEVLDKTVGNQTLPRFLGFADNRDFFYVLRKGNDGDIDGDDDEADAPGEP